MDTIADKPPSPFARAGRALMECWGAPRPGRRRNHPHAKASSHTAPPRRLSAQEQDEVQRARQRVEAWRGQMPPHSGLTGPLALVLPTPPLPTPQPGRRPSLAQRRGLTEDDMGLQLAVLDRVGDTLPVSQNLTVKILTAKDGLCAGVALVEAGDVGRASPGRIVVPAADLARLVQCLQLARQV